MALCLFGTASSSSSSLNDRRSQLKRQKTSALIPPTAAIANKPLKDFKAGKALHRDVDELVKACLRDPAINLYGVPDFLEKQVYRATIQLTLEALYNGLAGIHGQELLGHVFVVQRRSRRRMRIQRDIARLSNLADANDKVLEDVADRLLQNKFVNQPLIPDVIERALYANCLKIIFRVLDLLAVSFRITLCGHDIRIHLEPTTREAVQESALQRVAGMGGGPLSGGLTSIDMIQIKEIARRMADETMQTRKLGWWRRWVHSMSREFITQMHVTVYCLVLGVLDDLLENTEVQLLSDRVRFDLVPLEPGDDLESPKDGALQLASTDTATPVPMQVVYERVNPIVPLSIGILVGYLMRQLVLSRQLDIAAQYCRNLWNKLF
eukprot:scaffold987_cov183-Amphora_coffeaeformis.AAC.7